MATKGWAAPETERALLRAEELAEAGATLEQRFALSVGLFGILYVGGNLSAARERLKQTWDFVNEHPEPAFILEATHHTWSTALSAGELETAQRHVERGLALYEAQLRSVPLPLYSAHHPAVCAYGWGGQALWLRGYPEAAQRYASRSVSLAQELEDPVSIAWALFNEAQFQKILRAARPALETAEVAIGKAEEMGFPIYLATSRIVKGWALVELRRSDEGVDLIREGIAALAAIRVELNITLDWAILAEACAKAGRIDEGLNAIAEALRAVRQSGECFWERKSTGFMPRCCAHKAIQILPRPETALSSRSGLPANRTRNRSNCARPRASLDSFATPIAATKRGRCSGKSTAGSARASIPTI
jgi:tetratricopeptide (TPR) repeat protein